MPGLCPRVHRPVSEIEHPANGRAVAWLLTAWLFPAAGEERPDHIPEPESILGDAFLAPTDHLSLTATDSGTAPSELNSVWLKEGRKEVSENWNRSRKSLH